MGRYIIQVFGIIISTGYNYTIAYNYSPYRHFVFFKGFLGFFQCLVHKALIFFARIHRGNYTKYFSPSTARYDCGKMLRASSCRGSRFLYRAEKWPSNKRFAFASLAMVAASLAVECMVCSARLCISSIKVDSWYTRSASCNWGTMSVLKIVSEQYAYLRGGRGLVVSSPFTITIPSGV